jgi:hyperosmotically inducible protein
MLIGALAPITVWSQQTIGERMDDAEITARVKAALIEDDQIRARNIDVETQSGAVQLSGFVDSEAEKKAAEATALSVQGVSEIDNALIVGRESRTAGAVVDDSIITSKVKAQLANDAGLGTASAVNVEVRGGVVQLSGFVSSDAEKQRAAQVAQSVEGVADVRNDVAVR